MDKITITMDSQTLQLFNIIPEIHRNTAIAIALKLLQSSNYGSFFFENEVMKESNKKEVKNEKPSFALSSEGL